MINQLRSGATDSLAKLGDAGTFFAKIILSIRYTMANYRAEVFRQLADISFGSGAILVGGGTIGVMALLALSAGTSLGIEGFSGLELVGLSPLTGFVAASVNTRELAPLVAALALAAQVGCRFTAQLGSMRLHEEIDALAVMAVHPLRYLVTTRVIAAMLAIVPLYLIGLIGSWIASQAAVTIMFGQSPGTYEHYFAAFISGKDLVYSVIKVVVFALLVAVIHCWYGYNASGGPQGVGEATGRAIRASIVVVVIVDMLLTIAFWGHDPGIRVSG